MPCSQSLWAHRLGSEQTLLDFCLFQVKSDIDHLLILVMHVSVLNAAIGGASRAIIGPLPYPVVVVIVEIVKICVTVHLGILNFSRLVQILIVVDFRYIHLVGYVIRH